jgi:hypothetical protein
MGTAGTGGDGTGPNPIVIVPDSELCGGEPCADHSGERQFTHDGAPFGADSLFGDATRSAAIEPAVVYPSHQTMFPVNVSRIRFEWTEPAADLAYELSFEGDATDVLIFTTGGSWAPTEEEWDWVAESNRGGAVKFTVSALDPATPTQAWTSGTIDVFFSDAAVPGAVRVSKTRSHRSSIRTLRRRTPRYAWPVTRSLATDDTWPWATGGKRCERSTSTPST